jgi:hypothetical protein
MPLGQLHTMTGYLLLTKGDASFARRGACVIMRAVRISQPGSPVGWPCNIPAGLVEEKVLVWLFNALENYSQPLEGLFTAPTRGFHELSGELERTYRRASSEPPHGD